MKMHELPNQNDVTQVPIQGEFDREAWAANKGMDLAQLKGCTIPKWLSEIAYTEYVKHGGKGQSLNRLNERGGFSRTELLMLLRDALQNIDLPKF